MRTTRVGLLVGAGSMAAVLTGGVASAHAGSATGSDEAAAQSAFTRAHRTAATVSEADAVAVAVARYAGTASDAHLEDEGAGLRWEVKTDGGQGVREIQIDARTGAVVILASSSGSVENLNVSAFHGFRPQRRQIRATVAKLTPRWSASKRADQCVTPSLAGGGSNVAAMIACSSCTGGRPDRGRSSSAASPPVAYRTRQACTVGRLTPTSRPTSALLAPSAASNTIRACCANPAGIVADRIHSRSLCSSPARNTNSSTRDVRHCSNHRPESPFQHGPLA